MTRIEIKNLINYTIDRMNVGYNYIRGGHKIEWKGGQDGFYYLYNMEIYSDYEYKMLDKELDELTKKVTDFLKENDFMESDIWDA